MRTIVLCITLLLIATVAQAELFVPMPMVITAADSVGYAFNQSPLDITFNLSGKPAKVYLVINTKYSSSQKPASVQNGLKGWHYVNDIDTTVYVSSAMSYSPGNNQTITWNGKGNERSPQQYTDGAYAPAGTYQYYLWGYDSVNPRVSACDFIAIGSYWEAQYTKIYERDEQGNKLDQPWFMGSKWSEACGTNSAAYTARIGRGTHVRWQLGSNPSDASSLETTQCDGYESPVSDSALLYGAGIFDPHDWDTFYFVAHITEDNKSMPTKWTFVTEGNAIRDIEWNDWGKLSWARPVGAPEARRDALVTDADGEYIWVVSPGENPISQQWDRFRAIDFDASVQFDTQLQDFFMPDQPAASDGDTRTSSEINQSYSRFGKQFAITGEKSCLMELIDGSRILESSATKTGTWWTPSRGGDGYVIWGNSNGDYFLDNATDPSAAIPWACISSDYEKRAVGGIDRNGFLVAYLTYAGSNSAAVMTQDGSGIDYLQFAGGQSGTGVICDNGSIFDGLYVNKGASTSGDGSVVDHSYDGCMWIASDSDGGIIRYDTTSSVEETASPSLFSLAQNVPNPFNPTTTITYTTSVAGAVRLDVYTVAGQRVATLVDGVREAGSHSVVFDGKGLPSGVYFYRLETAGATLTGRMTLMK